MTEEFEAETGQVLDIQDVDAQKLRVLHFMAVKVQRTLENQRKRQRVSSPFHADSDPSVREADMWPRGWRSNVLLIGYYKLCIYAGYFGHRRMLAASV
jgi:hypothetical protein